MRYITFSDFGKMIKNSDQDIYIALYSNLINYLKIMKYFFIEKFSYPLLFRLFLCHVKWLMIWTVKPILFLSK
jgi:hypothetical protein